MTTALPAVSLVIPVYNEESRIPRFAGEVCRFAAGYPEPVEVIFVDDGSSDGTARLLSDLARDCPHARLAGYARNRGKGHAIAEGVAAARGQIVVFTDLDLSVPLEMLGCFVAAVRDGADVAIGSRRMPGAEIRVHQPRHRELMGDVFRRLTRCLLLPDVTDFTCGFKAFRAGAARDLFGSLTIPRWGFDVEILYLARRRGLNIVEIPVPWFDRDQTKVRLGTDALGSLRELLAIRLKAWRGDYDRPAKD